MSAFGSIPVAMITMHQVGRRNALDPVIAAEAFDLTPAEAKVAVALAHGDTPVDVAQQRNVALSTVRSQAKSAYLKIGVSCQSDLVRVLMELPRI